MGIFSLNASEKLQTIKLSNSRVLYMHIIYCSPDFIFVQKNVKAVGVARQNLSLAAGVRLKFGTGNCRIPSLRTSKRPVGSLRL